jgi:CelD/BcsL family acetyltransferase involved in cellulose biosynthesis
MESSSSIRGTVTRGSVDEASRGDMVRIRTIRTFQEFLALSDRWNTLLKNTPSDNVFLTWDWLYTWARHYVDESQIRIILAFKNDELIGIAPFYVHTRVKRMIKVREMRFIGSEDAGAMHLDFIVGRKHKDAVVRAVHRHLHEDAVGVWDLLILSELPAESSSIDLWERLVGEPGKVIEVAGTTAAPFIDLSRGLEHFVASLSANERYNLRRKQRRLEALGNVTYDRVSSTQHVDAAMDLMIDLHQTRWRQKGEGGVFGNDRRRVFHREIARAFSAKGWLRLDFLLLGGEAIAGVYAYTYNGCYWFYLPGLNPQAAPKNSPGILLLFHCIEDTAREGFKEFNLLTGTDDYKMAWATGLRRCVTLQYYNRHLRSAALKAVESGISILKILGR